MNEKQFKDRLIEARERKGLSQTELANLSEMAPTQLARYENGKAIPRRAAMMRLAQSLGVQPEWLMRGEVTSWPALISMPVSLAGDEKPPAALVIPPMYVDFVQGVAERLGISVPDAVVEIIKRYMVEIALAPTGHPRIPHMASLVAEYTDLELRVENLAAELAAMKAKSLQPVHFGGGSVFQEPPPAPVKPPAKTAKPAKKLKG